RSDRLHPRSHRQQHGGVRGNAAGRDQRCPLPHRGVGRQSQYRDPGGRYQPADGSRQPGGVWIGERQPPLLRNGTGAFPAGPAAMARHLRAADHSPGPLRRFHGRPRSPPRRHQDPADDRASVTAVALHLDPQICRNVEAAMGREWLVTNGLGGYASGTVAGVNTRRYHGLLVASLNPPVQRMVLLAALEEWLLVPDSERQPLSAQEYWDGTVYPDGFRLLEG